MSARKDFALRLIHALWENYVRRVPHARAYRDMIAEFGAVFISDHIAFRSLGLTVDGRDLGLQATCSLFHALGFREKGAMDFPAHRLFARFLQHEEPDFPKILVSQLKVEELDTEAQAVLREAVKDARLVLDEQDLEALRNLDSEPAPAGLFDKVLEHFSRLPWSPPTEAAVRKISPICPYGAWVLVHGYAVNHFAGYVNRHGVDALDDIEKLAGELKKRGVPLAGDIDGARGSRFRQIATEPSHVLVRVRDGAGHEKEIEWTYAGMKYVERGEAEENGEKRLFQGFLPPQSALTVEMTGTP